MRGAKRVLGALVAALLPACSGGAPVVRVVDGHEIEGRFISPEAYAEYLDGALLEQRGDLPGAEAAYERALREDPAAAEIWTRLGHLRCTRDRRAADAAFARARAKGPNLGSVWRAEAECALARGDAARAETSAMRAAAVDPDNALASYLVIRALVREGRLKEAERWLRAARLLYPGAAQLPPSLDAVLRSDALLSAGSLRPDPVPSGPSAAQAAARHRELIDALDRALIQGDREATRDAAVRARVENGWLALRAAELGQAELAKERAELALAAEPGNVDARIAALAAADLRRDDALLRKWATKLPSDRGTPSPSAVRVMAALLKRRVGADAARAFSEAWAGVHRAADGPHPAGTPDAPR